jgi:hypothetical protein
LIKEELENEGEGEDFNDDRGRKINIKRINLE